MGGIFVFVGSSLSREGERDSISEREGQIHGDLVECESSGMSRAYAG